MFEVETSIIFIESPILVGNRFQQGAKGGGLLFELPIGAWTTRTIGGTEELNLISSRIINLVHDTSVSKTAFNVTLASAHTDTTLIKQGIGLRTITGPYSADTGNIKDFRNDFVITFQT